MNDIHQHNPIDFYSDAFDDPLFVKCADCGEVLNVSRPMLESLYNRPLDISVELNNCPAHGAVYKDHRCPEFDGVEMRGQARSFPTGPADNVKHLGMTTDGERYTP